jgi:hypothetical protein
MAFTSLTTHYVTELKLSVSRKADTQFVRYLTIVDHNGAKVELCLFSESQDALESIQPAQTSVGLRAIHKIVDDFLAASERGQAGDIDTGAILAQIADITHPKSVTNDR